MVSQL